MFMTVNCKVILLGSGRHPLHAPNNSFSLDFTSSIPRNKAVVYFDQLLGAVCTQKLVELLFLAVFNVSLFTVSGD